MSTATKPTTKPTPPAQGASNPPPPPAQTAPQPRTRAALSMERRLALAIITILAACDTAKVVATSEIGKALEPARALVKDVQDKIVTPTVNRVAEIQKELNAEVAKGAQMNATKIKELSQELARNQKKLTGLQAQSV